MTTDRSDPAAGSSANLPDDVVRAFGERFRREPAVLVRAPGRVNLLGAHMDYSEGFVMPTAISRAVWLAAAPAGDESTTIHALDLGETSTLDLARLPLPRSQRDRPETSWVDYPAGVAWALREGGHGPVGADVVFGSDVPVAAGVSSSAAVEVAFILAWEELSGFRLQGPSRVLLGQRVENAYLGVQSGIMDQFASLFGRADHVLFLDCRSLSFERIPLPHGTTILVADTGVRRRLTDSDFNQRRAECGEAVSILERHLAGIRTLRDVPIDRLELHAHHLPETLRRRARHVVEECARVQSGAESLRQGDLETFGRMISQSHISSRDLYDVSIRELDTLAEAAWKSPGCYGARLTGAGFGGCVTALVEETAADSIRKRMEKAFKARFGNTPSIFSCTSADGAGIVQRDR